MSFPRPACQICGKDNHSARTCHFRNTQTFGFPSHGFAPGFVVPFGFPSPWFAVPSFNLTAEFLLAGVQSSPMWRHGPSTSAFPGSFQMPMPYPQLPPVATSQHLFMQHSNASGYGGADGGYDASVSSPVSGQVFFVILFHLLQLLQLVMPLVWACLRLQTHHLHRIGILIVKLQTLSLQISIIS